jgi:hypothetical protein
MQTKRADMPLRRSTSGRTAPLVSEGPQVGLGYPFSIAPSSLNCRGEVFLPLGIFAAASREVAMSEIRLTVKKKLAGPTGPHGRTGGN